LGARRSGCRWGLPDVGLKDARARRNAARKLLVEGGPGEHRKEQKATKAERASNGFKVVAREWFSAYSTANRAKSHADQIISRLERDVFPWIGERPIAEIKAAELLRALGERRS
jgi:hypothetical protein